MRGCEKTANFCQRLSGDTRSPPESAATPASFPSGEYYRLFLATALVGLRFCDRNVFAAIAFGFEDLVFDVLLFDEADRRAFSVGSLAFTAFTALLARRFVSEETSVFPFAARLPIIVPAIPPTTAPTGPPMTPPTTAPVTPPAVCLDTGKLLLEFWEEVFFFMP
jgi:hypothetical protein